MLKLRTRIQIDLVIQSRLRWIAALVYWFLPR